MSIWSFSQHVVFLFFFFFFCKKNLLFPFPFHAFFFFYCRESYKCTQPTSGERPKQRLILHEITYSFISKAPEHAIACTSGPRSISQNSGVATGQSRGAECPPWQRKIWQKSGKRGRKSGKRGKKRKKWEESFTLPLLTDRAGYATEPKGPLLSPKGSRFRIQHPSQRMLTTGLLTLVTS